MAEPSPSTPVIQNWGHREVAGFHSDLRDLPETANARENKIEVLQDTPTFLRNGKGAVGWEKKMRGRKEKEDSNIEGKKGIWNFIKA